MNLTPLDVSQQRFRKSLFGLDRSEVETHLELVANEMVSITRERQKLENEAEELRQMLQEYRERERALKETMLAAQRVTEEMKLNAQKECDMIISRAEMSAERMLDEAQRRHASLLMENRELKAQKTRAKFELRGLLKIHLDMLDEDDFDEATNFKPVEELKNWAEQNPVAPAGGVPYVEGFEKET